MKNVATNNTAQDIVVSRCLFAINIVVLIKAPALSQNGKYWKDIYCKYYELI